MDAIEIWPIGIICHPLKRGTNAELRQYRSVLVVDPALTAALDGIEEYSHIVVAFWMDNIAFWKRAIRKAKVPYAPTYVAPRGVFATRLPSRPNPIGISTVALVERRYNTLVVEGLDAFDGTPILDIKPFTGHVLEDVREFRVPDWEQPMKQQNP